MAPGSIFIILIFQHLVISFAFYFAFYFSLCISIPKIPKILFIISIRSHFCKWPWRDWQPLSALVALSYCFCVGTSDSRVASYWIDTLVLKNWGKYLRYFAASSSPLRGNPTQCSRGSTPLGGAIERVSPSPPPLLYIRGRGYPIDTQVDHWSFSHVRCPLHHNPPRLYRSGA